MRLLICGAGQYGVMVKEIAVATEKFSEIIFLDDNSNLAIGKICDIDKIEYDQGIVAIGNVELRRNLLEGIKNPAIIIHPAATVSPTAKIGEGAIIEAGAVVSANAEIGKGTIVMANAVVGHDAKVGDFCQLKYNSTVPERCIVPNNTRLGYNTVYGEKNI